MKKKPQKKSSLRNENLKQTELQVGPGNRGQKKSKKRNGFDLDLIWIEIGVSKTNKFKEWARSPCIENHFSSYKYR